MFFFNANSKTFIINTPIRVINHHFEEHLRSSLSWTKKWRQINFQKSNWLFRRSETKKTDFSFLVNQNFGLGLINSLLFVFTKSEKSPNVYVTFAKWIYKWALYWMFLPRSNFSQIRLLPYLTFPRFVWPPYHLW